MELEAAKMIGAGLASIALAGAGVGIGIIFDKIIYKIPKVSVSQNIWEIQNSGFNWGIPPLSAAKTSFTKKKLKNIDWKNIFLIIKFKMQKEWLTLLPIQIIQLLLQGQTLKAN